MSLASSSEYDRLEPAPCTDARSAFLGVLAPHRGIDCGDPLATGVPPPTYGPSSAFRTPSTVYALHSLVGLFHPTTTSGIRLSGVFPTTQPARLSAVRALLSLVTGSCPGLPRDSVTDALAFRALIQAAIRRPRRGGLDLVATRSPLRLRSFGFFSRHLAAAFTVAPLTTFVRQFLRVTLTTGPQRFADTWPDPLSLDDPPVRASRPSVSTTEMVRRGSALHQIGRAHV